MKKILKPFLLFAAVAGFSLFLGCDKETPPMDESNAPGGRTITVNVDMPTDGATKVALAETESGNISLKWKEGDKLNFTFVSGGITETVTDVPITLIGEGGKRASFSLTVPEGVGSSYNLFGLYGANFKPNSTVIELPAYGAGADLASIEDSFVMGFVQRGIVDGETPTLSFVVGGAIIGVWISNSSANALNINDLSISGTDSYEWICNATGAAEMEMDTPEMPTFVEEKRDSGSLLTILDDGSITIPPGESQRFYAMILPTDQPETSKTLDVNINGETLPAALPAMEMEWNKYYNFRVNFKSDNSWERVPYGLHYKDVLPANTNCHLINPPTKPGFTYRFKMPIDRVNVFAATSFGKAGDVPTIDAGTKWVANIIWTDTDIKDIITLTPTGSTGIGPDAMIEFEVGYQAEFPYGNAVIGIKLADENFDPIEAAINAGYLWSWHIWISDYAGQTQDISIGDPPQLLMDRNLGARSGIIGDPRSVGLMYQWGRKDPLVGGTFAFWNRDTESSSMMKTTPFNSWTNTANRVDYTVGGTVAWTVSHPVSFVKSVGNTKYGETHWMITNSNTLWTNTKKTIYDPCPKGYRLPENIRPSSGTYSAFGQINETNFVVYPPGAAEADVKGRIIEPDVWFPTTGFLSEKTGEITSVRNFAYMTSVTRGDGKNAKDETELYVRALPVRYNSPTDNYALGYSRGRGLPARCIVWNGTED